MKQRRPRPGIPPLSSTGEHETLVAACDVIASVPATVEWSPPYAVRYGGLGLTSKLGPRLYVGLEPFGTAGPVLGPVRYYLPEQRVFAELSHDRHNELEERLMNALSSYEGGRFHLPLRIHCISEYPFFRGLHADSGLATALAAALHVRVGALSPTQIDELTARPTGKLLDDEKDDFWPVFSLAWTLESAIANYRPEGHLTFSLFVQSPHPTVFWRLSDYAAGEPSPDEDPSLLKPYGCRLTELLPKTEGLGAHRAVHAVHDPIASLDVALIFTGREIDSEQVYRAHRQNFRKSLNNRYERAVGHLRKITDVQSPPTTPRFVSLTGRSGEPLVEDATAADRMMDLLVVQSVLTFEALYRVAEGGIASDPLRDFVLAVGLAQDLYRLFGLSSGHIDEAVRVTRSVTRRLTRQKIAARLVGPGRAGCLMLIATRGSLKFALPTIVEKLQRALNSSGRSVHCHWFSEHDGYSPGGAALRVEQDLRTGRVFPLQGKKALVFREWIGGAAEPARLIDRETWNEVLKKVDVALDTTKGHVLMVDQKKVELDTEVGEQALKLLDLLLSRSVTGGSAIEIDGHTVVDALWGRTEKGVPKTVHISHIKGKLVRPLADALEGAARIILHPREDATMTEPDHRSYFTIRFEPGDDARIALLQMRRSEALRAASPRSP